MGGVIRAHTSPVLSSVRPFTRADSICVGQSWAIKSLTCFLLLRDLQYRFIFLKQLLSSDKPQVLTCQRHFLMECFFLPQFPPSPVAHITVKAAAAGTDSPTGDGSPTDE